MDIVAERHLALNIAAGQHDEAAPAPPRVVWKFGAGGWPILLNARAEMEIRAAVPVGSRFLAAAEQQGVPSVWIEVPEEAPTERGKVAVNRLFRLITTGETIPPDALYRGTLVMRDEDVRGRLVVHLYEVGAPEDDR